MPFLHSATIGVWSGVGGRHEPARLNGIAHFAEHLAFRGTPKRSAIEISRAVEGLGGYINAFTCEDHTCHYARAGAAHLPVLVEVLADLYSNTRFAPADVDREREIIREEILMIHDQPCVQADELLAEVVWPGHPLGRPLTGTEESIGRFTAQHLERFTRDFHTGRNSVITVAGRIDPDETFALLDRHFSILPAGKTPRYLREKPWPNAGRVALRSSETEQAHLSMGVRTFGRHDPRRFALKLLSVLLGENMSSRLFQELRERRGWCYSVSSGVMTLSDTGLFSISAGLDPSKAPAACRLLLSELRRVAKIAPSKAELRRARDYTIGQTMMGLESTCNQMMWMGESVLGYGRALDPDEARDRLLAVTAAEIRSVAEELLVPGNIAMAIVGPIEDEREIARWFT
jgi:predicted Zn-dependent peptidase